MWKLSCILILLAGCTISPSPQPLKLTLDRHLSDWYQAECPHWVAGGSQVWIKNDCEDHAIMQP